MQVLSAQQCSEREHMVARLGILSKPLQKFIDLKKVLIGEFKLSASGNHNQCKMMQMENSNETDK